MAEGILKTSGADISVAVTGIAGPDGGSEEKPVGTVFIAVSDIKCTVCKHYKFRGNRARIRQLTALTALNLLRLKLQETDTQN
jgi:nicotinamide-nucleotide amidase